MQKHVQTLKLHATEAQSLFILASFFSLKSFVTLAQKWLFFPRVDVAIFTLEQILSYHGMCAEEDI